MKERYYPLQVWVISIIVSPVIIYLHFLLEQLPATDFNFSDLAFIIVLIPIGGVILLPAFLVYSFVFDFLSKKGYSLLIQKLIPVLVVSLIIFISYYFIIPKICGSFFGYKEMVFPIIYSLAFALTTLFLNKNE